METISAVKTSQVASDRESVLSVKDLKVVFSGFKALKGVDLEVGKNEIVTISVQMELAKVLYLMRSLANLQ